MFLNTDAKYIWLNGAFQPFNDTNIHLLSHTLHYGLGAFEGVRAYETETGGAIFRLRDHTERLFDLQPHLHQGHKQRNTPLNK